MAEQKEPIEICKSCGQPVTAHGEDCSLVAVKKEYQEKIHEYKIMEGLTDEFVKNVEEGKINFEKQMKEIDDYIQELFLESKKQKNPEDYQKIWDDLKEELQKLSDEFKNLYSEFLYYKPLVIQRIREAFDEKLKAKLEKASKIIVSERGNIANIRGRQFSDYDTATQEISRIITQERLKIQKFKKIFEDIKNY